MALVRFKAIKSGQIDPRYFKTYEGNAPPQMIVAARHYNNLFEAPVLFYAVIIIAAVISLQGFWVHLWAWTYLVARVAQAVIHLTSNKIMWRMRSFVLGWVALTSLWILVLLEVIKRA